MIRTRQILATTALALLAASGCAMPKMPTWDDWNVTKYEHRLKETKYQAPTRMVVLWSPAIQNGPNVAKAQRGFGGRIYFYNAADQAVPVEGQLIVYGYNDTLENQRHVKPDKKFAFTPQQFTAHYSPTELGASYSVWVGWDDVGGAQSEVSLVPIFTSTSGHIVVGQTSRNVLPGQNTPATNTQVETSTMTSQVRDERIPPAAFPQPTSYVPISPTTHGMVEQAAYQQPAAAFQPQQVGAPYGVQQASMQQLLPGSNQGLANPAMPMPGAAMSSAQPQMDTMSITLPGSMTQRLIAAGAQQQPQPYRQNMSPVPTSTPATGAALNSQGQVLSPPPAVQTPTTFNAPTNESRSWGPVTPRRGALPLGPQSRYAPGSPQAPASPGPQPSGGPLPMQPPHGAPGPAHPLQPQLGQQSAGPGGGGVAPGNRW